MDNQDNKLWKTNSAFSGKDLNRNFDDINQDDSSDEEEEEKQNKSYDLAEAVGSEKFKKYIKGIKDGIIYNYSYNPTSPTYVHDSEIQKIMKDEGCDWDEAVQIKFNFNEDKKLIKETKGFYKDIPQSYFYIKFRTGILDETTDIKETEIVKSFLLHNFGRMYVYSSEIDEPYRKNKKLLGAYYTKSKKKRKFLNQSTFENNTMGKFGVKSKIGQKDDKFTIHNLQELLALGRILRRSQIRKHGEIKDLSFKDDLTEAHINFCVKFGNSSALVKETLIASKSGLGRTDTERNYSTGRKQVCFPSCDMVHLPSDKGDYNSGYKDIQYLPAESNFDNTISTLSKSKANITNSEDERNLDKIIRLMKGLSIGAQNEIIKKFHCQKTADQINAQLINNVCCGKDISNISSKYQEKIYAITYLLFKTEVYRSPATLINNMQMLELIEYGKLSFEDVFVKQMMPMSMKNAIRAGRSLNAKYNNKKFSFYYYSNPFAYKSWTSKENRETEVDLIKKESALMDMWLKMKLEQSKYSENEIKDILDNPTKPENLKIICKEINQLGIKFNLPSLKPLERVYCDGMVGVQFTTTKPLFTNTVDRQNNNNIENSFGGMC